MENFKIFQNFSKFVFLSKNLKITKISKKHIFKPSKKNMDLFELLQNDSQLTPSIISDISFLQQNFSYYKVLLSSLFDSQSTQNLDLFLQNLQGKPQTSLLIPFLGSYYLEALDNTLFNRFLLIFRSFFSNKLEISNFQKSLEFVIQNYEANIKFLDGISTIIGQNQIIPLKITLKERFQTIFIQDPIFFESLHSVFLIELEKFQRLIIDTYGQKFDSGFLSQILLYFSKSGSHMSNLEPQFFKLISLACVEFGVLEKLQDCIFKLLNIDLLAFLRCDLENFDNYEQNCFFNNAYQYSQVFLQGFLQRIASSFNNPLISDVLQHISHKLELSIAENFCIICKDRVFDMILAYPESEKLFFDLQAAIQKANYLSEIGDSLLSCVTKRLLIPGVITQTILNQYLNILKVLQLLDRGLIFSKITAPIKAYLLKRPDTLRCIIAHLTEDSENYTKLVREYVKIPSKEEQQYELSSDEDEAEAEKWEVLPLINKKNSLVRVKYQESDLVSVLVDLYGSQEAFLNEYQIMLAEKLLCAKEYSIDEEIKNIELLKLRFGENNLQSCNIIVKDVKESKKIDQNLHAKYDKSQTITFRQNQDLLTLDKLHAMFASKGYWPINYEYQNALKVPIGLNQVFEEYSRKFTEMKAIRKLIWHNQLGYVNLSLGFDNGEFEFKCLPIHAILISYLDETSILIKYNNIKLI